MHTVTWLTWLLASLAAAALAPHPLYGALIFLATAVVFAAQRGDSALARSYGLFMRAGAWVFCGYMLFGVVTVGGARGATVLLELPALALPPWLGGVVLGGPITAEALAWSATRGLMIWTLLAVFGAFNALVDYYRVLRLTPPALFHAGLVVTIALAFVPGVIRSAGEIVGAQRARGHRFGGLPSWLALAAPLLAGSLERSMQLAEALDARGYGRAAADDRALARRQVGALAGLTLIAGGLFSWLYFGPGPGLWAALALLAGGALLVARSLLALGRLVRRSVYRRERWRPADGLVVAGCLAAVATLAGLRLAGAELAYVPFPRFTLPGFDLRAGLALMLLAAPALVAPPPPPRVARRPARAPRRDEAAAPAREPAREL